jgi:UPF0042 nucleotide-binding protein
MKVIITGMSGAGKSQVIQILEDFGFFCIDNLPPQLIEIFLKLCEESNNEIENIALVTDVRGDVFLKGKDSPLFNYKNHLGEVKLLFLDARDEVLVSRYQETRRNHPLSNCSGNLLEAIKKERESLNDLKEMAQIVIDTSEISVSELKGKIRKFIKEEINNETQKPKVNIYSFGFKYESPVGADYVFDVRFLPNPFYKKELRGLTGEDQAVRDYVMSFKEAKIFYDKVFGLLDFVIPEFKNVSKDTVEIAIGCTGGQHRSVTFAYLLNKALIDKGYQTKLNHRDIKKNRSNH